MNLIVFYTVLRFKLINLYKVYIVHNSLNVFDIWLKIYFALYYW